MTELDVVAAIDAAADTLTECDRLPFLHALLCRARDEIVALRDLMEALKGEPYRWRLAALEEAARACERVATWRSQNEAAGCAAAVRALKEKP